MSFTSHSIVWNAQLAATVDALTAGACLVKSPAGFLPATTANRTTYGRAYGIAVTSGDSENRVVELQVCGVLDASVSGLPPGVASWVRVSATGSLERCAPSGSDDVVGWCEADGAVHLSFGFITPVMVRGGAFELPITDAALAGAPRTLTAMDHAELGGLDQLTVGGDVFFTDAKTHDYVTILARVSIDWSIDPLASTMFGTVDGVHIANGKYIGFLDLADISTLPTTGRVRIPYNDALAKSIIAVKDSAGVDRIFLQYGAGDQWVMGNVAQTLTLNVYTAVIQTSTGGIEIYPRGAYGLSITDAGIKCGQPIYGDSAAPSPFSVHGAIDVDIAGDDHVLTATEYAREFIRISGNDVAGPWRVNLPTVSDDAHAYYKYLFVTAVDFATNVVFTAKDDTTDDLSLAPGTSALVCVDATHGLRKLCNLAFTP